MSPIGERGGVDRGHQPDPVGEVQLDQGGEQHVGGRHPGQRQQREQQEDGDAARSRARTPSPTTTASSASSVTRCTPDGPGQPRGQRAEAGEGQHRQRGEHARRWWATCPRPCAELVQHRADADRGGPQVEGEDHDADDHQDLLGAGVLVLPRARHLRHSPTRPGPLTGPAARGATRGRAVGCAPCVNNPSSRPLRSSDCASATPSAAGCASPATATSPGPSSGRWSAPGCRWRTPPGFNPHPRISYAGAAPTGAASEAEYLEIGLAARGRPRRRSTPRSTRRCRPVSTWSRSWSRPAGRSPTGWRPATGGSRVPGLDAGRRRRGGRARSSPPTRCRSSG